MRSSDSPFPCAWWGTGLGDLLPESVRPEVFTYGRFAFEHLPRLPFELRGDFAWLANAPVQEHAIAGEKPGRLAAALASLRQSAAHAGVGLPEPFTKFLGDRDLQSRVRSNTLCVLDVCPELVRSPIAGGWLARFLADSQGCVFWYLYLTENGSDHAVISSPGFYGTENEPWDEEPDSSEIVFAAESFEAFLCRFWLENEIWFADYEKTPMPAQGREYLARYGRQES
jgi:hypothetical protein